MPTLDATPAQAAPTVTFEADMAELELCVQQLESGHMPLDQLLSGYQRAAQLLANCAARLQTVQDQIQVLDGQVFKPWDGA